ncbi:MAG TPA: hypothetical protein VME40_12395 [Caulobacteraceae bacterium]|nr:hypothetical protein [Caulobacteraceae bacterium]
MRTASSGPDLIMELRPSNEAPEEEAPPMADQISAPDDHRLDRLGRFVAMAVALAAICVGILFGVELTRPGPLFTKNVASPPAVASARG